MHLRSGIEPQSSGLAAYTFIHLATSLTLVIDLTWYLFQLQAIGYFIPLAYSMLEASCCLGKHSTSKLQLLDLIGLMTEG